MLTPGFLAAGRRRVRRIALAGAALLAVAGPACAGTLVYTPTNPSFGGNPLNGPTLFNNAQVQNQYTHSGGLGAGSTPLTPGQIFAQQLTSQLYSSLANKITQAIFGENAAPSGTFSFEGTTITYQTVDGNIEITISDGQTTTSVTVPAGP
jgi:curli production assembly/transport component CsgF